MVAALWNSTPTSKTNFLNNFWVRENLFLTNKPTVWGTCCYCELGKWSPFVLRGETEGWKGDVPRHSNNPASHLKVSIGMFETYQRTLGGIVSLLNISNATSR